MGIHCGKQNYSYHELLSKQTEMEITKAKFQRELILTLHHFSVGEGLREILITLSKPEAELTKALSIQALFHVVTQVSKDLCRNITWDA